MNSFNILGYKSVLISKTIVPIFFKKNKTFISHHSCPFCVINRRGRKRGQFHMLNNGVLSFKVAVNFKLLLIACAFYVCNSHLHFIFCELLSLVLGSNDIITAPCRRYS